MKKVLWVIWVVFNAGIASAVLIDWQATGVPSNDGWTLSGSGSEALVPGQESPGEISDTTYWALTMPDGTDTSKTQAYRDFGEALTLDDCVEVRFKYDGGTEKKDGGFEIHLLDREAKTVISFYKANSVNNFRVWDKVKKTGIDSWEEASIAVVQGREYLYHVEAAGADSSLVKLSRRNEDGTLKEVWAVTVEQAALTDVVGIRVSVSDLAGQEGAPDTFYWGKVTVRPRVSP